jgi:hypothetical protein
VLEGLAVNPSTANEVLSSNGSAVEWFALAGDISGTPNAVTVDRLQGHNVGNAAPSNGQVLMWNTASNQWQPAPGQTGNGSYVFISQTSLVIPGTVHQFGTANLIVDCYDTESPPHRVEADSIQIDPVTYNVTIGFTNAQSGYCVVNGAGTPGGGAGGGAITPVGGDLSGTTAGATVTGIQNRPVSSAAPANGQTLVWNASGSLWAPGSSSGGGSVTSVFGRTGAVVAQSGDYAFGQIGGTVGSGQAPLSGDLAGSTVGATVTGIQNRPVATTPPVNGQTLIWNSASNIWAPGTVSGGSGGVASVFGRTGTVTAQSGDYSFGQISGSVSSGQLPAAGGDVSGTLTAATVTGIQSRAVANTAPANGQALVWSSSGNAWTPGTVSGGGGAVLSVFGRTGAITAASGDYSFGQISGSLALSQMPSGTISNSTSGNAATAAALASTPVNCTSGQFATGITANGNANCGIPSGGGGGGASMASQLGDLQVVYTSATVLTIGANCSTVTPCNVRFGSQVYRITASATATVSAGTGTAYVYVTSSGTLTVGHNLTLTCSTGCAALAGITAFPVNVIPVANWGAQTGAWTTGSDQRAFQSSKMLAGGEGIVVTEAPGQSTLAVDNGVIPTYLMNTAVLNFPSISNGACAADLTMTVAGANLGNSVAPGWPALPAGLLGTMLVSATNTVTVRLCNFSGSALQPPSASYTATIVRNY